MAKKYEISQGRKPVSVEEENCGWDLTSLLGGQTDRYIEVKSRAALGGVALTPNEWIKAQRFGKDYWPYVVVNCKTKPELHLIQDPEPPPGSVIPSVCPGHCGSGGSHLCGCCARLWYRPVLASSHR